MAEKGGMETQTARSWTELGELLFRGSWDPEIRRFRARSAFRGGSRADRTLRPGVCRLGGVTRAKERHLIRNFRKYARRSFVGDESLWNWLALAQHHGLPTRLLDWTYSPYVALHFVTADLNRFDEDGEVHVASLNRINDLLPPALRDEITGEGSFVFTGELLSKVAGSLEELEELGDESFVLFLEPPSLDDRIINQVALFSVTSDPEVELDTWFNAHAGTCRRVRIPAELKWEVRDKLDQVNITERVLFPGLDGLSSWLRRYYTERA
jgi:hypothetical protein